MLRLIHNQTGSGAIVVDDIDDGLPNKEVHRMGSSSDPKTYLRDGYANSPKQPNYVPYSNLVDSTIAGYIDLDETPRVILSAAKGKIYNLSPRRANLVTVLNFVAADVVAPVLTSAALGGGGDVTLTGTTMTSLIPQITTVAFTTSNASKKLAGASSPNGDIKYTAVATGSGATVITVRHVVAGLGTTLSVGVIGNAITVNSATDGGGLVTSTSADVAAAVALSPAAALVTATALGNGLGLIAAVGATNLAYLSTTVTAAQIVTAGGTVSATSIVVPASLLAGASTVTSFARVRANAQYTATVALS